MGKGNSNSSGKHDFYLNRMKSVLHFSFSFLFIISSCSYGDFTTHTLNSGNDFYNYYLFERNENKNNDNLIVFLDGSTMNSSLGIKGSILPWKSFSAAYILQKKLSEDFDLLVPDRMNMETGKDYSGDTLRLSEYTLENRTIASAKSIDAVIQQNRYENILIIGYSEGGLILPKVYNQLVDKQKVKKIISISAGGFTYYDLAKTTLKERGLKDNYVDSTISEINKNPDAINKFAFGHPYKKWKDFLYYNPVDEYKKIDIPLLVIQGDSDKNVSVESSRYLKRKFEELGKKNITYIELKNADHNFEEEADQLIYDI